MHTKLQEDDIVEAQANTLVETWLVTYASFTELEQGRRQQHRACDASTIETMEYFSLKRSTVADRGQSNLSSKVYVRSTKSGKVQKIVRELYLRQDIPCSSNLCRECLEIAPTDYSKRGWYCISLHTAPRLTSHSRAVRTVRYARRIQRLPQWTISGT